MPENTLFLRLEGPLQAWGLDGRLVYRPTAGEPTKSGIIGLLACALGRPRTADLSEFDGLRIGVRVDRPGHLVRDYHTVGARIGSVTAGGKIKRTETTKEIETLESVRMYLADASFLAAAMGPADLTAACAEALQRPTWPVFLGRKSCPPSRPVFAGIGEHPDLRTALASLPWEARRGDGAPPEVLRLVLESGPDVPGAEARNDHPVYFWKREDHQFALHRPRFAFEDSLPVGLPPEGKGLWIRAVEPDDGRSSGSRGYSIRDPIWNGIGERSIRRRRLAMDGHTCQLTGLPADEVHHIAYAADIVTSTDPMDPRVEAHIRDDLVSLSRLAHEALTMLEYRYDMGRARIDPRIDRWRGRVMAVIQDILTQRARPTRRSGARVR